MKVNVLPVFFAAALFGAPCVFAQEAGTGEGRMAEKSDEDLKAEFQRLAVEISRGMGQLEGEIARVSLPPRRAEELKAELDGVLARIEKGEATSMHSGLKAWLQENPGKAAEVIGAQGDELAALLADEARLLARLQSRSTELASALGTEGTLATVLRRQIELEAKLAELVSKQEEQSKAVAKDLDDILEIAYEMRDRAPP